MIINIKYYISGLLILLATFAAGRLTAPEKIKTETKTVTVEVEKKVQDTNQKKNTKTTEIVNKDGSKVITTTTTVDTDTKVKTNIDQTTKSDTIKSEQKSSSSLIIEGLVSTNINNSTGLTYGAGVSNNLIGPVRIGGFGFTDGKVGVSLGIQF